jgi:hypothetical protein
MGRLRYGWKSRCSRSLKDSLSSVLDVLQLVQLPPVLPCVCIPPYYSREVRQWLSENYQESWIDCGREAPASWPARPPDLSPDFVLWVYLKSKVYARIVDT